MSVRPPLSGIQCAIRGLFATAVLIPTFVYGGPALGELFGRATSARLRAHIESTQQHDFPDAVRSAMPSIAGSVTERDLLALAAAVCEDARARQGAGRGAARAVATVVPQVGPRWAARLERMARDTCVTGLD